MPSIQVGQIGTLVFQPSTAGLEAELIAGVAWQPQGGQQAVKFRAPDQVEGMAAGSGDYKATVTLSTPGEKVTYKFTVDCVVPGLPAMPPMVPVTIEVVLPVVGPPPTPPPPPITPNREENARDN